MLATVALLAMQCCKLKAWLSDAMQPYGSTLSLFPLRGSDACSQKCCAMYHAVCRAP